MPMSISSSLGFECHRPRAFHLSSPAAGMWSVRALTRTATESMWTGLLGTPNSLICHHSRSTPHSFTLAALRAQGVIHRPGCGVSYRPDLVLRDRAGWFRDSCYPFLYDMAGVMATWNTDPPRNLDRLELEVRDGVVYVNPRAITPGTGQTLEGYEFHAGATLLPLRPLVPAR